MTDKYVVKKDAVIFNSLHLVKDTVWKTRQNASTTDSILLSRHDVTIALTPAELKEYFEECQD